MDLASVRVTASMSFPEVAERDSSAGQVLVDGDLGSTADRFAAVVSGIGTIEFNRDITVGHTRFSQLGRSGSLMRRIMI